MCNARIAVKQRPYLVMWKRTSWVRDEIAADIMTLSGNRGRLSRSAVCRFSLFAALAFPRHCPVASRNCVKPSVQKNTVDLILFPSHFSNSPLLFPLTNFIFC